MEQMKTVTMATVVKGDTNRGAISGAPGAHPVGVGAGAAGGGLPGAVIGSAVAGPIGAGVAAVVGAVSGGMAGKSAPEAVNPTAEHDFWRGEFQTRPYFTRGTPYEQYGAAFQYGWESYANHRGKTFTEVEAEMGRNWESLRGQSKLSWNHAKAAAFDGWQRVQQNTM